MDTNCQTYACLLLLLTGKLQTTCNYAFWENQLYMHLRTILDTVIKSDTLDSNNRLRYLPNEIEILNSYVLAQIVSIRTCHVPVAIDSHSCPSCIPCTSTGSYWRKCYEGNPRAPIVMTLRCIQAGLPAYYHSCPPQYTTLHMLHVIEASSIKPQAYWLTSFTHEICP